MLAPASVAVVGASGGDGLGRAVLANLVDGGFHGVVSPVDRAGGVVHSMRAARGLAELDEPPELVVIAVPADEVLDGRARTRPSTAPRRCSSCRRGSRTRASEGRAREAGSCSRSSAPRGCGMVGPNCLGVLNTDPDVSPERDVRAARACPPGGLAVSSQSGAHRHRAARARRRARGSGVSALRVARQPRRRVDERPARAVGGGRAHGGGRAVPRDLRQPRALRAASPSACRAASRSWPSRAAAPRSRRADAGSHTAAALRDEAVVDALLRQAGVLRFHSGEELFDAAEFFERQPLPRGRRVGIVSNSTGMATLAADAARARGLVVGEVEDGRRNPLVLGIHAGPGEYAAGVGVAARRTRRSTRSMAFYVDLSGGDPLAVLRAVSRRPRRRRTSPSSPRSWARTAACPPAELGGVPNFLFPEACAGVLARAVQRREWLSRPLGQRPRYGDVDAEAARAVIAARLAGGRRGLAERRRGARRCSPPTASPAVATHVVRGRRDRRCAAAETIDGPVALKADFPPPAHAGDVDAVLLGLEGDDAVRAGWRELERRVRAAGRPWTGAVVQPLVAAGADVLVGAVPTRRSAPSWRIGLGGRQAGLGAHDGVPPAADHGRRGRRADRRVGARRHPARTASAAARCSTASAARADPPRRAASARRAGDHRGRLQPDPLHAQDCMTLDLRLRVERRRPVERVKTW